MQNSGLRRWRVAMWTALVLALATNIHKILSSLSYYRMLHGNYPFYVAETLDKLAAGLLCCLGIYGIHRIGLRGIFRELGLAAPVLPAFAFALIASSPMLIGFAVTRRVSREFSVPSLLFLAVLSPFVEEVGFRGFGFWQLYRRARWPFWLAVLLPAVLFGLGHVEQGRGFKEAIGIFILTVVGSALFSWLLDQWQNLWVPFALHLCMDLWWEVFSVSETALGGWFPFAMQTVAVAFAILLTFYAKHRGFLRRPLATLE
jgi:membrane protease YdiL (CAAX protease family)